MLRLRIITLAALFAALGAALACGSSASSDSGHWLGGTADASPPDGGVDLGSAYPKADPDPDGGTHAGPSFDGGGEEAGGVGAACSGKTGAAGNSTLTLTSGGMARDSLLHVPASYDPSHGAMLVINYHGFTSNAPEEEVITRMDGTSDARGFIVAYPDGVGSSWNAGDCCGDAWTNSVDDIQFTKDLLALIESRYCIDPKRVYATGFSNGGFFSHRLACQMADTFAAVAPVSGVLGMPPAECTPSRPIAVIDFHGTADPLVPYDGGAPLLQANFGPLTFRSVADTLSNWRSKDDCLGAGDVIYQQGDATCVDYGPCAGGSEVTLCTLNGDGHNWPGGVPVPVLGNTSTSISASDTMAAFFAAHPMP